MDITEAIGLDNGARFFRGDLHIHSVVGSHDVSDASATPEAIVSLACSEGLDLIAIADHNEITGIGPALEAAQGTGLLVVPAVELSTAHGHLLCYFATLDALNRFHAKLSLADRGMANSRCSTGFIDILNLVKEGGGFAVLAHVDGGKGLETELPGSPPHKKDIICHPALLGIELKRGDSPISYSDLDPDGDRKLLGRQRIEALGLGKNQYLARLLNSDSHSLNALGRNAAGDRKVTRYKMQDVSFEALKLALQDSDARVRIEEDVPARIPMVRALAMHGGFLSDQGVHFSPNLNCIIGGRGTGKSTTFEAIRCLTGHAGAADVVDSEVWPDLIDLVVTDQSGQTIKMQRRRDSVVEDPDDPDAMLPSFAVECYAQSEAATISQNATADPAGLLSFLDRFIGVAADLKEEREVRQALLESEADLKKAAENVALIPGVDRDLKYKKSQLAALEAQKGKEVIALIRKLEKEKEVRSSLRRDLDELLGLTSNEALRECIESIETSVDPADLTIGGDEYQAIATQAAAFKSKVVAAETDLQDAAKALGAVMDKELAAWRVKEATARAEIDQKREALEQSGVRLDIVFINSLSTDEAKLTERLRKLKTWEPALERARKERAELVKKRWDIRQRIATKRSAYGVKASTTLKAVLTDLSVSLKFLHSAHSPSGCSVISEAMSWRTSRVPRAELLIETLSLPGLVQAVLKKDKATIKGVKEKDGSTVFSDADAQAVIDNLTPPEVMHKLQAVEVSDKPQLIVAKAMAGRAQPMIRDFSRLSLGQKQSVLLALMLSAESNRPLIIDQPEDHLDSEFIYQTLVPVLRRAKERRQVIIVTHNANIAVLGDAEQIIVLKAQDDNGRIVSSGSIDHPATRQFACDILEGSAEAFKRRAAIYGVT
ncbi:MAG: AAA family ATPase [Sphingopyxis sp.]|uniref:TrlF family AAA-like ATPase n=1 Tax=Sphingopyxis sp. TaxID=1908224 RepID=UPI002AB9AD5B|nr:AAA family ATPase [Sphingopyxis sp.]MDZ3831936.1 AAA family ATPase [Sphingopyxis sp.]